ncbi:MAG: thioredoxin family protein [Leptospiraceae bacterium]|nr:thioredoxin family protein [Leptospiraceae bacterium]
MNKFLVIAVCFLTANIVLTQDVPKTETPKTAVPAKTESEVPKKQVGIPFVKAEWKDIVAQATKEKKYIFIDAYAVWCNPCKWMDENVYNSKKAEEYFTPKFVSIKMDMEKEEGLLFREKYKVDAYPTYLFFDSSGKIIHRFQGPLEVDNFIKEVDNTFLPEKAFYELKRKYEKGVKDEKTLYEYVYASYKAFGEVNQDLLEDYFDTQDDFLNKKNWQILDEFVLDIKSKPFRYLVAHKEKFFPVFGKDVVEKKIYLTKMSYYSKKEDWKNYAIVAVGYAEKYSMDDWKDLDAIAWKLSEKVKDKKVLAKAETLVKRSIKLEPNFLNYETHAQVLFKLEKYKEAHLVTMNSIRMAKQSGESYDNSISLLNLIIQKLLIQLDGKKGK